MRYFVLNNIIFFSELFLDNKSEFGKCGEQAQTQNSIFKEFKLCHLQNQYLIEQYLLKKF